MTEDRFSFYFGTISFVALVFGIAVLVYSAPTRPERRPGYSEFMLECLESGKRYNDCYHLFALKTEHLK